jgi:hypothetical protein
MDAKRVETLGREEGVQGDESDEERTWMHDGEGG